MRSILVFAVVSAASFAPPLALADQAAVLVINQSNSYRPWPNTIINEIRRIMTARAGGSVAVYTEDLDLYRFSGPGYLEGAEKYFREKYRGKPIGTIISVGSSALDYGLQLRTSIWPTIPLVFAAVDRKTADLNNVPGVTGITIQLKLADMIRAARAVLPDTSRFALVGDRLESQLYYGQFAEELVDYSRNFEFIDLTGLPLNEVKQRVAVLPSHTAVLYIGINSDRTTVYVSADVIPVLAEAANRPIIVSVETYFGTGAIGGFILSPEQVGREAGHLALRVFEGEDASTIPVMASNSMRPMFDWRQLKRWDVDETSLPPGSEIRFRTPSTWEQYRWEILAAFAIMLVQSGMLTGLLIERRRRHSAEEESRQRIRQVIHLNRTATAGALSASVAHQLNQPLGAILNYAETAEIMLSQRAPNLAQLKEIVSDIRRDDERASEVIKHLRELLKQKSEMDLQTFDLNDAINAAVQILEPEARKRGIALNSAIPHAIFPIRADRVQLEQVILNLVANGMDAVSACAPNQRRLMVQAIRGGESEVEILVSDSGPGIPKESLKEIFDTFYTTKANGTGLGLSIARTIVETYGGRIWAENREGGGAVFRITLPLTTNPTYSL
jgi:signal transduction histidine kinase